MTRGEAAKELLKVADRLDAWADSARIRQLHMPDGPEATALRNMNTNYTNLSLKISTIAQEIDNCGVTSNLEL